MHARCKKLGVANPSEVGSHGEAVIRSGQFSFVLHPFAARYSHWMWHSVARLKMWLLVEADNWARHTTCVLVCVPVTVTIGGVPRHLRKLTNLLCSRLRTGRPRRRPRPIHWPPFTTTANTRNVDVLTLLSRLEVPSRMLLLSPPHVRPATTE